MRFQGEIGRHSLGSVRLEPGSHASPSEGVCIVELASMIGGEPFSDHPACVCPVIAAFLRSWNDRSSHAQRQRLIPYAKRVVGSRASARVTRRRRDVCLTWAGADLTGNRLRRHASRLAVRARIMLLFGVQSALRLNEGAGELAARAVFSRYGSETGLELVNTLLAIGGEDAPRAGANGNGNGHRDGLHDAELARDPIAGANGASGNGSHRERAAPSPSAEERAASSARD